MEYLKFALISTTCLSISFLYYRLVFRTDSSFRQLRIFLLLAIFISLLIPLSNFELNISLINFEGLNEELPVRSQAVFSGQGQVQHINKNVIEKNSRVKAGFFSSLNLKSLSLYIYQTISFLLVSRILIQLILFVYQYVRSPKRRKGKFVFIYTNKFENTFSFFHWIFIPKEFKNNKDINGILMHEQVHASQYHSIDIIAIELLAAVMWFNPVVWMMRKEIQLVHEYLADEGALSTGIDRLKYQALLINQVTEERLISLSSSFNHSLIKKRMIMMTKQEFNQGTKLKILTLIPLIAILLLGVACVNAQNKTKSVTAISPVKMNVFYIGVDNPIKVAASGYDPSELEVEVENGVIKGSNGEYIVNPRQLGTATVFVKADGKIIQETRFRVKKVPSPRVMVADVYGGKIKKSVLIAQYGIFSGMENFDYDLSFEIVSFTISTTKNGLVEELSSDSNKFTEDQRKLLLDLEREQRLYIQDVKCKAPDGSIRKLAPMSLVII